MQHRITLTLTCQELFRESLYRPTPRCACVMPQMSPAVGTSGPGREALSTPTCQLLSPYIPLLRGLPPHSLHEHLPQYSFGKQRWTSAQEQSRTQPLTERGSKSTSLAAANKECLQFLVLRASSFSFPTLQPLQYTALTGHSLYKILFQIYSFYSHKWAHICICVTWMGPLPPQAPFGVFTLSKLRLTCHPYSVQLSSVAQSCATPWDPMDCSTPGFPVHHQLPELIQTHIHRISDAIQPSHPLSSPSPPAFNLSQHQGLFQWVSSSHQVAKVLEFQLQHQSFQWILRIDFLLGWTGLISFLFKGLSRVFSSTTVQKHQFFRAQLSL